MTKTDEAVNWTVWDRLPKFLGLLFFYLCGQTTKHSFSPLRNLLVSHFANVRHSNPVAAHSVLEKNICHYKLDVILNTK